MIATATTPPLRLVLPAPDPAAWIERHVVRDRTEEGAPPRPVVDLSGLMADDAATLRGVHDRLVGEGTPAKAAAMYLSGWFGGGVASQVGCVLALAGAGVLVDPATIRWHLHPDGWPERVEVGSRVVVGPRHPWAGVDDVEVVPDDATVLKRSVASLVALATPIVEVCRSLAKVGRAGLWNEVADDLGMALAHQVRVPVDDDMIAALGAALAQPDTPWTKTPRLAFAPSDHLGRAHIVQKGGCCLAYTGHLEEPDPAELDEDHRAYLERFPRQPDQPRYCSTCTFRNFEDCTDRQLYWLEQRYAVALLPAEHHADGATHG